MKSLPAASIMLHVGAHKTGTTSIQAALYAVTDDLAKQGVTNLVADEEETANGAARAVQRLPRSGSSGEPVSYSVWTTLAEQARAAGATRVSISAEAFAVSEPVVIQKIIEDLGAERVQVIITLRPIAKILPSQWQQDLHGAWQSTKFDDWLRQTLSDTRSSKGIGPLAIPHKFWFRHRHDDLVRRWVDAVGSHRVTVIVVSDHDRFELLETFEELLALKAGTLPRESASRNQSMTLPEMQIMQRYGELLEETDLGRRIVQQSRYHKALRILRKIRPESDHDARLVIPQWSLDRVSAVQEEILKGIESSGVSIIGSLSTLQWRPAAQHGSEEGGLVQSIPPDELERITARMLKSAGRRLGLDGVPETSGEALRRARGVGSRRYLARLYSGGLRLVRMAARLIRLRG